MSKMENFVFPKSEEQVSIAKAREIGYTEHIV